MNHLEQGGPTKTAIPIQFQPSQHIANVKQAAKGLLQQMQSAWCSLIACSPVGNNSELVGEMCITDKGTRILDYQRVGQIEVCR